MKLTLRNCATSALAASLVLALAACNPPSDAEADAPAAAAASGDAAATTAIAGLKTDKEQASYMIGMQLGQSLEPIKDDIDLDTVMKAVRTTLDDGELLMTPEQAQQVAAAFGERMQAKMTAEAEAAGQKNLTDGAAFLAANGKKPGVTTTASGLQYEVMTAGDGARPDGDDAVRVHYKGTLLDGTTFDSSYDRGEPVVFAIGQVVPGWQEGLQLMPVGSKYRLWVPSALGYGEQGTPGGPIGPNAVLVFEVELLEIVDASAQGAPAASPAPSQG